MVEFQASVDDKQAIGTGAAVGLLTGTIGLAATDMLSGTPVGALAGAVLGGATAAALSDPALRKQTRNAAVADLVSSVIVFLAFLGLLLLGPVLGGNPVAGGLYTLIFALPVGFGIAVPIALISVCVAAISGLAIALGRRVFTTSPLESVR